MAVAGAIPDGALLKVGSFTFDFVRASYELTGVRQNYLNQGACGQVLENTDLTYQVYLQGLCTLGEAEQIQEELEDVLGRAPSLTILRRATPDATLYQNTVKSARLEPNQAELRARFTNLATLSLIMTLTILPDGQSGGVSAFRQVRYLAATGDFDWANDDIRALLFRDGSTVPDELYATSLADFVDLAEATSVGYARVVTTGRSVSNGSMLELLIDSPTFAAMADDVEPVAGMILYAHNGADSVNVPLFLVSFVPYDPSGAARTIYTNLSGVF